MRLTKREKILLFGSLIMAISVLFITYIYTPLKKDISNLKTESSELTRQIDEKKGKEELVNGLQIEIAKLEEDIISKQDHILKIWDQPELLYFIENTIGKLGIKDTITFTDPVDAGGIRSGDIQISIKTDYKDIQKIIKKLEEAKYLSTVEGFTITRKVQFGSVEEGEKELVASMTLRFYSQNQETNYPEEKEYEFLKDSIKKHFGKENIFK